MKNNIVLGIWRMLYPILIYTAMTIFIMSVAPIVLQFILLDAGQASKILEGQILAVTLLSALCTIPILWCFFKEDQKRIGAPSVYESIAKRIWIELILLGISAGVGINNLFLLIDMDSIFPGYEEVSQNLYVGILWLEITAIVFVIPIVEELIFRGLCFLRIREYTGFLPAALISSLLFAVYHGNMLQGIYAFIVGMIICYTYEQCRNIKAPIVVHMAANGASLYMTNTEMYNKLYENNILIYSVTAVLLLLTVAIIYKLSRYQARLSSE